MFTPFPELSEPDGKPLTYAEGVDLRCSGCGDVIPGGAWLFESVDEGMVVGITARAGGTDAPIVHQCGDN